MKAGLLASILWCLYYASGSALAGPTVLTFMALERSIHCFYQEIDLNKHTGQVQFDFVVMDGGDRDIDLEVEDPDGKIHFEGERRTDGALNLTLKKSGILRICFSNEFSMFTSKQVSLELEVHSKEDDPDDTLKYYRKSDLILITDQTEMNLDEVEHSQKFIRRDSVYGHRNAYYLNSSVQMAAVIITVGMLLTNISQVLILRNFFRQKSTS